jgi:tetratricopeptide (TPR) repeat protein
LRKQVPAALVLFALALALRLLYLRQIEGVPAAAVLLGDGEAYDLWARRIAAGDWLGSEAFYQAPLYPYFLAVLYAAAGPSVLVVRVVQALLGAGACLLLARAGGRIFGPAAGWTAGALFAVYPIALYFDGLVQKVALEAVLLALLLCLLAELAVRGWKGPRLWLAAGATLGLLGLVRENTLVLAPLLAGYAWAKERRVKPGALFLAGLALVLVPVGLRNLAVGGSFHLTTYQLGTNLYIGNHAGANGLYAPLTPGGGTWRREREDAVALAEKALGRALTPAEVSGYWTGRALAFVREQPLQWLQLMGRKAALVWNRVEIGDHDSPELFAEGSSLLRGLLRVWHFGVLCPLAAVGIVLTWRRGRAPLWLLAVLAALAVSVAAFYVFARYRFSLVPVLVLFAGAGLVELVRGARERTLPGTARVLAAAAAAVAALASNVSLVSSDEILANAHFNLGWRLEGEERGDGDMAAAGAEYARALAILPAFPDALNNLGNVLARQGRLPEAHARFAAAVALDPAHGPAQLNLGKVLVEEGKQEAALPHLDQAVRVRPDDPEALEALARALFALARREEAALHYATLARTAPSPAHYNNLGSALASAGRLKEASEAFQAALRLDPAFVEAHENLALTFVHLGDLEAAAAHYGEVVRLRPQAEQARANLARVRAMQSGARSRP